MRPIEAYKSLGALVAVIMVICLAFLVIKWPQGKHRTFSQHAAAYKRTVIYYIALFSITLPLLTLFFVGWFIPTFNLTTWFTVFVILSAVTQYLCTLIPEVGGWKSKYHRVLAFWSALFLIPSTFIIVFTHTIDPIARLIALLCGLVMTGIFTTLVVSKAEHRYFLVLQASYFAAFFIATLSATYIR